MGNGVDDRLVRWRTIAYVAWGIIGIVLVLLGAGWGLARISGALAVFVVAFLLVFLLQGPVRTMQGWGLSRPLSASIAMLTVLVLFGVFLVFLIPPIAGQVVDFAEFMSTFHGSDKEAELLQWVQGLFREGTWDLLITYWNQFSRSVGTLFLNAGKVIATSLVSATSSIVNVVITLVMGFVVAFWILKDLPKMRNEIRTLAGDEYEDDLENALTTVTRVVGGYLRGQTIASLVTGLIVGVGLALIGVRYALVLGILAYLLNYIPYVGPLIVGLIAAAVGFFTSPLAALLAVAVCVGAQQVTDIFITPRVMSEQVDLHPVLVIFSLLVGGSLFGFWGMIFAIPFAATAKGLFVYYWERRNNRALATEDGALFRTPTTELEEGECAEVEPEPESTIEELEQGSV